MISSIHRNLVGILIACTCLCFTCARDSNQSLADRELLALVAGNALTENVAHEIDSRGLAFHPTDAYRIQELDSALQSGGGPEAGFVMGELLRRQEEWTPAASV